MVLSLLTLMILQNPEFGLICGFVLLFKSKMTKNFLEIFWMFDFQIERVSFGRDAGRRSAGEEPATDDLRREAVHRKGLSAGRWAIFGKSFNFLARYVPTFYCYATENDQKLAKIRIASCNFSEKLKFLFFFRNIIFRLTKSAIRSRFCWTKRAELTSKYLSTRGISRKIWTISWFFIL